jgi:hypothetical protein
MRNDQATERERADPPSIRPTVAHVGQTFVAEILSALIFATCFAYASGTWPGFAGFLQQYELPGGAVFSEVFAPGLAEYNHHLYFLAFLAAGFVFTLATTLPWGASFVLFGLASAAFIDLGAWQAVGQAAPAFITAAILAALVDSLTRDEDRAWWFKRRLLHGSVTALAYLALVVGLIAPAAKGLASVAQ